VYIHTHTNIYIYIYHFCYLKLVALQFGLHIAIWLFDLLLI